jgi:hypothetical protein
MAHIKNQLKQIPNHMAFRYNEMFHHYTSRHVNPAVHITSYPMACGNYFVTAEGGLTTTLATNFICICFTQPCFNDLLIIQGRLLRNIVSSVNNELEKCGRILGYYSDTVPELCCWNREDP